MSTQRRCDFFKAVNGLWYVRLGNFEHAWDAEDCTIYGGFTSEETAYEYVSNHHSNPGGSWTDPSGQAPVPSNAKRPNTGHSWSYPNHNFRARR